MQGPGHAGNREEARSQSERNLPESGANLGQRGQPRGEADIKRPRRRRKYGPISQVAKSKGQLTQRSRLREWSQWPLAETRSWGGMEGWWDGGLVGWRPGRWKAKLLGTSSNRRWRRMRVAQPQETGQARGMQRKQVSA